MSWRPPPLVALALGVTLMVPLAAFVEFPGEQRAKQALGLASDSCVVLDAGTDGSRTEAPMPTLRDGPASATVGDQVYLVGGIAEFNDDFTRARSVDAVERFDISEATWATMPRLPRRLNHVGLAAADGVVYALGGMLDGFRDGSATGESWRLDPKVGRWQALAPMPTARGEGAVAVTNGRIYVVGGKRRGQAALDVVESYDPRTNSWRTHEPLPTPRNHLAVTVEAGLLYALGGRQADNVSLAVHEVYDPRADRWESLPEMPSIKAGFAYVTTPRGLVAVSGENLAKSVIYGSVFRYAPKERRWVRLAGLEHPRHGFGHAYVDGRLYTFGGSTCGGFSPRPESYSMALP